MGKQEQMTTMTSYAEGRIGAEEYTTQDAKQAYAVLGSGEPDYTLQIGGTKGYAESEMDKGTYLEQKMNGEYATGVEVVGQEDYAIQSMNGDREEGRGELHQTRFEWPLRGSEDGRSRLHAGLGRRRVCHDLDRQHLLAELQ